MRDRSYESSIAPTLSYPRTNADERAAVAAAEFTAGGGFVPLADQKHKPGAQDLAGEAILELVELNTVAPRPVATRLEGIT